MFFRSSVLVWFTLSTLTAQSPFQPVPAAIADTLSFHHSLPDFQATDLAGKTWRLSDLRGRLTVVEIWATWCRPCRAEAPAVQRLYNQWGPNGKTQVLTFSLDADPEAARSYIRQNGHTFPAIVDPELERRLFPQEGAIPQSWVVDRQGRRSEAFHEWSFGRIAMEVERLAKAD